MGGGECKWGVCDTTEPAVREAQLSSRQLLPRGNVGPVFPTLWFQVQDVTL